MSTSFSRPRQAARSALAAAAVILLLPMLNQGCAGDRKQTVEPVEQVYQRALEKLDKEKYYAARSLLQGLQTRLPQDDRALLPLVQLKLADSFYHDGGILNLGEALGAYRTFLTYYGQRDEAAYAQYQVGMCYFGQVLAPDRDQELTYSAIAEFGKVGRIYPESSYADQAQNRIQECRELLAEHELGIGRFYYKREHYLAAADRFRVILRDYPQYSGTEEVLFLLGTCLLETANPDEARLYFDRLFHEYPDGELTRKGRKRLEKAGEG